MLVVAASGNTSIVASMLHALPRKTHYTSDASVFIPKGPQTISHTAHEGTNIDPEMSGRF